MNLPATKNKMKSSIGSSPSPNKPLSEIRKKRKLYVTTTPRILSFSCFSPPSDKELDTSDYPSFLSGKCVNLALVYFMNMLFSRLSTTQDTLYFPCSQTSIKFATCI